ncbi:MAG: 50S ribosomal protein L10 [Gammaproteobacteria bacterium]
MVLKLEDKKAIVEEVAVVAAAATSAVAAHYRGLTVAEMTELRVKARQAEVYMRVVRNTLARRAVQETPFACLQDALIGPMLLLFSQQDPGAAARLVRDFVRDHEKLEVKALAMGGRLLDAKELKTVADLPTREHALGMLVGVMIAPITKLVRTLAEPYARLTRTVAAVRDKKQAD